MCDVCAGKSMRQMVKEIKLDVARCGWCTMLIGGDVDTPAFAYTIGLTERRHPELLVTGRMGEESADMLRLLAHFVLDHGDRLVPGEVVELRERKVYLAPLDEPREVLLMAARVYSWRVTALQAVWADDSGRFPWEQRPPDVLTQPLYGTPPVDWRQTG